jgi:hypothetical protein
MCIATWNSPPCATTGRGRGSECSASQNKPIDAVSVLRYGTHVISSFNDKRTTAIFLGKVPKGFPTGIADVSRQPTRLRAAVDESYFAAGWSAKARLLFRLGPIFLTAAIVAWRVGAASVWGQHYYQNWHKNWAEWPLFALPFLIIVWHVILCVGESRTAYYIGYFVAHFLLFALIWFICMMILSGDSL